MSNEHMTLTLVVKIRPDDFDSQSIAWIDELKDKAAEQGEVTSCILTQIPAQIDFS
jgi:predicted RND superfamily exporter protein